MKRLLLTIEPEELEALLELARRELRTPYDQARYLLREALERHGWLPPQRVEQRPAGAVQEVPSEHTSVSS